MIKTINPKPHDYLAPHSIPYNSSEFLRHERITVKEDGRKMRKLYSPSHMSYEVVRLATFYVWSYDYVNAAELAKAGFYYTKKDDQVQCYFCKGVVGYWERGDRPIREHEKHFPNCPLVQGALTSNIPLGCGTEEQDEDLNALLNRCLLKALENSIPLSYRLLQTDSMLCDKVAYPPYKLLEKRIYSLTNWPKENVPSVQKIAAAGFFYTGISDFVLCFSCGGGLFNWSKDDDPWSDHKKYYGHCPLVCTKADESRKSFSNMEIAPEEEDLLLQYPISQKLLGMGLSRLSIKSAMKEHLEKYSYLPGTFMDCTDVVVEWDERNRNELNRIEEADNLNQCSQNVRNHTGEKIEHSLAGSTNSKVELLLHQIEEERLKYTCRRCRKHEIEVISLPCQHFHYCKSCISQTNNCLTCNKKILKIIYPCISR